MQIQVLKFADYQARP